jgi:hypothetical protein
MNFIDLLAAETAMATHAETVQHITKHRRLLHQARDNQQGWLFRQGCRMACHFGRQLVMLGERLEGYGRPQPSFQSGSR